MKVVSQLFFLLCFLYCGKLYCQTIKKDKMDLLLDSVENIAKDNINIQIDLNDDQYIRSVQRGGLESNDLYQIGSISKVFTSILILQLIQDKRLDFKSTLASYFLNVPNSDSITIEHLLKHRSGVFDITNIKKYKSWNADDISHNLILDSISHYSPIFNPNERFEYSNSNYILLSLILEKEYADSFESILDSKLCKPCGLKNTFLDTTNSINRTNSKISLGAGGIVSSPEDVILFFRCAFESNKILNPILKEKLLNFEGMYGYGIMKANYYNLQSYGHTGLIDDSNCSSFYFPDSRMSFAIFSKDQTFNLNILIISILDILYDESENNNAILDFNDYLGTYASQSFPLQLKIFKKEEKLYGQATNQSPFLLSFEEENLFSFRPANLRIRFEPEKKGLILLQKGKKILFSKLN